MRPYRCRLRALVDGEFVTAERRRTAGYVVVAYRAVPQAALAKALIPPLPSLAVGIGLLILRHFQLFNKRGPETLI